MRECSRNNGSPTTEKKESIKDFALVKGVVVAVFGGIMSASMAFAFTAGKPIAAASVKAGTAEVFKNMPHPGPGAWREGSRPTSFPR